MNVPPYRLLLVAVIGLLLLSPAPIRVAAAGAPVESSIQAFLDRQPGVLKSYRDGGHSAAEVIQAATIYYGISPRILLALLEASGALLSDPAPSPQTLRQPFGSAGPDGFVVQLDWAGRELRAGLGPYDRFAQAFQRYFDNELPEQRHPAPAAAAGFLQRPWPAGTRVIHLAYFDHMYPTVDTDRPDNGFVVNYLGHGSVQYDGHDGHDFYFPDRPIGTYILAAGDGVAHASTHRGNGVWIEHSNGYVSVYWHLNQFASIFRGKVDTGQGVRVHAGDLIGSSGKSGFVSGSPHLHFELRHNGKQVDPYGWYGPGSDPCVAYVACEASVWLWSSALAGEFDFTPPQAAQADRTPPQATLAINPPSDLLFLADFDTGPLQQVGAGMPSIMGRPDFDAAKFGAGARISGADRLAYPIAGNLSLDQGTIAFWARLPARYPETGNGRQYLLAASAHADESPIYTGTLALRRDRLGPGGAPRWDFWTTPDSGAASRDDLAVPDTLAPGLHHFAISWDRARQSKMLFLDGALASQSSGVTLPTDVGAALDLGRWNLASNASGVGFDELAIYGRALTPAEVAQLAQRSAPLSASATRVSSPDLQVQAHALDDGGAIMSVQLGVNGAFGDPQPLETQYQLRLPEASGAYTVAARLFDRAGNSTTVSATVALELAGLPQAAASGQAGSAQARVSAEADPPCTGGFCIYLPYVQRSNPGVDTTNLPENWLDRLNAYRAASGLSPAIEDPIFSADLAKHANYMLLNVPTEGIRHEETPGKPGYTPEGNQAAAESNLWFPNNPSTQPAAAIDIWMASKEHRYGMLRPELATTGFALVCNSQYCGTGLNVIRGLSGTNTQPDGVVYPGDHQRGVAAGEYISWQFAPYYGADLAQAYPLAVLTSARLYDAQQQLVPITTTTPDGFWNIVTATPNAPLAPGTTYTIEMHVTLGERQLTRSWSFTTR